MKEKGVSMVEHYCFEEHEDLKRAAMECMCNLVMDESVRKSFLLCNLKSSRFSGRN